MPHFETILSFTYLAKDPVEAATQFMYNLKSADWFVTVRDMASGKVHVVDTDTWEELPAFEPEASHVRQFRCIVNDEELLTINACHTNGYLLPRPTQAKQSWIKGLHILTLTTSEVSRQVMWARQQGMTRDTNLNDRKYEALMVGMMGHELSNKLFPADVLGPQVNRRIAAVSLYYEGATNLKEVNIDGAYMIGECWSDDLGYNVELYPVRGLLHTQWALHQAIRKIEANLIYEEEA